MVVVVILILIVVVVFCFKKANKQLQDKVTNTEAKDFVDSVQDNKENAAIRAKEAVLETPAYPCTPELVNQVFETYYTSYDGQFELPIRCKIKYQDQEGRISERWIDVCGSEGEGDTLLHCYCWSQKAPRQFRTSRIMECVTEDGTVIDNPGIYFKTIYKDSPYNHLERLRKEKKEIFILLVFLARSDGAFRKAEKKLIGNYLRKFDEKIKSEHIIWRLEQIKPSEKEFRDALNSATKKWEEDEKQSFLKIISELYEDDKMTPEKEKFYNEIVKRLKS